MARRLFRMRRVREEFAGPRVPRTQGEGSLPRLRKEYVKVETAVGSSARQWRQ